MSSLAGKRRASSAVSSSVSGEGHQRHNQRQRSHSSATHQQTANFGHSPASGQQQPQRSVHRGSGGGGGLLNGLRNVHIFRRRSTVDNSRIRQPLMEESQAMSVTPQHQHHPHSLNPTATTTTNANATDVLMEMTTGINAANTATSITGTTIEEEMDDAIEGVDDVAASAAIEKGSRRLTTTSCPASKENEKFILNKMPMTTSHENFTTNTTTALVANTTTMAITPATTTTTLMPSAISHLTSLPRCTSTTASSAVASINGNTINNNLTQPLTLPASCHPKVHNTAPTTTISFGSERNEAISIEPRAGQASTTNATTNSNNLNLLDSTLIDDSL